MDISSRIMAAVTAAVLSAAAFGCASKNKDSGTSSETEAPTASAGAESSTDTTEAASSEVTTAEDKSSDTTTADTVTTAAATTTAAQTTEKAAPEEPKKGFDNRFEAAKAYYNAYITGNADAVYDMFCSEEIEAYQAYIGAKEEFEGKNPQVVFKRSAVINAIKDSIGNIHRIMGEKSDVPPDKWTVSLTEEIMRDTGENELSDFNKTLGTEFTAASDCGYVYYQDGNDEHAFIGNGCAFVELDGRWYLSYSTVMNAELITYMDIF